MIYNNKVYANANEKFVKNTILYGYVDQETYQYSLFHDAEFTKPVLSTEAVELFLNDAVVFYPYGESGERFRFEKLTFCEGDGSCMMGGGDNWYTASPESEETEE